MLAPLVQLRPDARDEQRGERTGDAARELGVEGDNRILRAAREERRRVRVHALQVERDLQRSGEAPVGRWVTQDGHGVEGLAAA